MSFWIKKDGLWVPVNQAYAKVNGSWQTMTESSARTYLMENKPDFYGGYIPEADYVTNLLPQFVQNYWDFTNLTVTSWSSTTGGTGPTGNIISMNTLNSVAEGFISTKSDYYPMLHVGHTYYIRWWSKKEMSYYGQVSYEVYWPEKPNPIVPNNYGTSTTNWVRFSYVLTLNSSQWTSTTTDGNYKLRFDVNNRKYAGPYRHADPLLIDLTADYTNQGYPIPSKSELDGKPYFYGQRDITQW